MARRPSEVPKSVIAQLNRGERETANLAEGLAMDLVKLAGNAVPHAAKAVKQAVGGDASYVAKMKTIGETLRDELGLDGVLERLADHPADKARSWQAYAIAAEPGLSIGRRLELIRLLADDHHFSVREWAWLALRPRVIEELDLAIGLLTDWTEDDSANVRRYATEVTRPRGVWCSHIPALKEEPQRGLPLLEPLKTDGSKYVQDSVANWLNDASKSRPDWVLELTSRWLKEGNGSPTARICRRATRSL
ncbi:MAG: DNA alkylation repair protein [Planctomycetota bacterium]